MEIINKCFTSGNRRPGMLKKFSLHKVKNKV
ncbi:hypothetical protein 7t3_0218 [Salmonella phage 7t3]|nr:hypothetical protein 7t3_0218 [Salmonella phage 7t3]